jgi:hypothetical protein
MEERKFSILITEGKRQGKIFSQAQVSPPAVGRHPRVPLWEPQEFLSGVFQGRKRFRRTDGKVKPF